MLAVSALGGCASVRDVGLRVSVAGGAPAAGAEVRAIRLRSGPVPLPLSGATLKELLSEGKTAQGGLADADGRTRLGLTEGAPHLIEARAWPMAASAGREAAWCVYVLEADGVSLRRSEGGGEQDLRLEVTR